MSIFAYEEINSSESQEYLKSDIYNSLIQLESLIGTLPSNSGWDILKIHAAIDLGWTFDHALKSLQSPLLLLRSIKNWIDKILIYKEMNQGSIFLASTSGISELSKWERAKEGFNYFWPKNTSNENFDESLIIAKERLKQISIQFPEFKSHCQGSKVLDVGCGPGRYMYELCHEYSIDSAVGVDSGEQIIEANKERFASLPQLSFMVGTCGDLSSFEPDSFDIVLSNGVIHHSGVPLTQALPEHVRVLKTGGLMFLFVYGDGGLELRIWESMQRILNTIPIHTFYQYCSAFITPKRLQGLMDHAYGSFYYTDREDLEILLSKHFQSYERVKGVYGMDVTSELYDSYPYFDLMCGSGMHRYLCKK